MKPDNVSGAIRDLAVKIGLKGVSLHSLRHAHASTLLAASVPIANVSKRLGHRDCTPPRKSTNTPYRTRFRTLLRRGTSDG